VATLLENVVGAFLLGALLEALVRRGDETPGVRRVRLGVGTGFLGGFTTFSSLAIEAERLLADGAVGTAVGYVSVSLVLGFLACLAGVGLAAARHRRRTAP
jgi:CrcB protein